MQSFRDAIKYLVAAVLLLVPTLARADVKPHALISDGMVLQQGREVCVWGTAEPGEKVIVRFRDQEQSTTSSSDVPH
jgi:sialate O-acetylesterase